MKTKLKVFLTDSIYAVLSLSLELTDGQKQLAEALSISKQEQENLIGQKMQEVLYLLGNSDEA